MSKLAIWGGKVAGRDHIRKGTNCQDAMSFWQGTIMGEPIISAAVADGCGTGKYSEVGANLAVDYMVKQSRSLVRTVPLNKLHIALYKKLNSYLEQIVHSHEVFDPLEKAIFVNDHLLFTLIGVIVYQDTCLVYHSGDGIVQINDDTRFMFEYENQPPYIGYHLIDHEFLPTDRSKLPDSFGTIELPLSDLNNLAIGTDAWLDELDLLDQIWALEDHPNALQRKMRVWSDMDHLFSDDAALVMIRQKEG